MANIKHGIVSILMEKELKNLENFEWHLLAQEFRGKFAHLFDLLVSIMMPKESSKEMEKLLPRIGMMYSILMQTRHPSLSLVQRLVSVLLMDNICDQNVI